MKTYVVTSTPLNYTLISHTDQAIFAACRVLLDDCTRLKIKESPEEDRKVIFEWVSNNNQGLEYLVFDTIGKNNFTAGGKHFVRNRLSYFSDAPFNMWDYITEAEKRTVITYSDLNHKVFLDDMGYDKKSFFMPHGGPNPAEVQLDFADRDIDVLVLGRLDTPNPAGRFSELFAGKDPIVVKIIDTASELALYENQEPYIALKKAAAEFGFDIHQAMTKEQLLGILRYFSPWIELQNRVSLLREMKDMSLVFLGPIRDDIPGITDQKHVFHKEQRGDVCLDFMKRSKVVLNSVSVFPGGSHERIWFGMANGTALFTDYSDFVSQSFTDEKDILFIDNKNQKGSVGKLKNAFETKDALAQISENAVPVYARNHTWEHRLAPVLANCFEIIGKNNFKLVE